MQFNPHQSNGVQFDQDRISLVVANEGYGDCFPVIFELYMYGNIFVGIKMRVRYHTKKNRTL